MKARFVAFVQDEGDHLGDNIQTESGKERAMKVMWTGLLMVMAAPASSAGPAAGGLDWMAGTWESSDGERWTEEHWSAPRGGTMIGYSRSGRGDTLREFEFIRIAPAADDVLVYHASPGGRPPVPFRLVEQGENRAGFANPSHDFPQRITYRRDGDRMVATISAMDGGNATSWTYRRRD
jgi:hypothetical protein